MIYERIEKAEFVNRPNRFIANCKVNGISEVVHVKNTGRCKELLVPGATVYLQKSDNPDRKTKWDLIAVEKGNRLINMDSQVPNKAVYEWLKEGNLFGEDSYIKPETKYKNSRFDVYVEKEDRKAFIEVKGVTLEEDGVVRFPDAPSERAVKHVTELVSAVEEGYEAYVFFVIQMEDVKYFTPNIKTHKAFADALKMAEEKGVHILAYDCIVTNDSIKINKPVNVYLN